MGGSLLIQLLMVQFDTLPIQCRHIEHMHEGVLFTKNILNICMKELYSQKIFFDEMKAVRT